MARFGPTFSFFSRLRRGALPPSAPDGFRRFSFFSLGGLFSFFSPFSPPSSSPDYNYYLKHGLNCFL